MANRHKNYMRGGKAHKHGDMDYTCNAGGNSDVLAAAKKKRKDGGEVAVPGRATGGRLDRKKYGGSVGKSPFTTAGGGRADKSPFFK